MELNSREPRRTSETCDIPRTLHHKINHIIAPALRTTHTCSCSSGNWYLSSSERFTVPNSLARVITVQSHKSVFVARVNESSTRGDQYLRGPDAFIPTSFSTVSSPINVTTLS